MKDTKTIGERTEAIVMAALIKKGRTILLPFGDNQRYDLVIDEGEGQFSRVQCKTGCITDRHPGVISFNTASTGGWTGGKCKISGYHGQIEFFGVYCPQTDKVYLVPIGEVRNREGLLRVEAPKNKQLKGVRWAKLYEV